MIFDLAQPLYNNGPQFPDQPPNSVRYHQRAKVKGATVERLEVMTHSGSHVDAPFHYEPQLPSISELPLSHFYGPCVAIDLRPIQPKHPIDASDLRKHEAVLASGVFVLLKTGWGDRRTNSKSFLTELLYGKRRHFAALPILIANASGAWTRPIVWDSGDLDGDAPAPEQTTKIPGSVAALLELERTAE